MDAAQKFRKTEMNQSKSRKKTQPRAQTSSRLEGKEREVGTGFKVRCASRNGGDVQSSEKANPSTKKVPAYQWKKKGASDAPDAKESV